MAVPKQKISKSKGRKRQSHLALKPGTYPPCSRCGEPKLPHRICPNCGYYNGRQILTDKNQPS